MSGLHPGVAFVALNYVNYVKVISKLDAVWLSHLPGTEAVFWGKVHWSLGPEVWPWRGVFYVFYDKRVFFFFFFLVRNVMKSRVFVPVTWRRKWRKCDRVRWEQNDGCSSWPSGASIPPSPWLRTQDGEKVSGNAVSMTTVNRSVSVTYTQVKH